MTDSTEYVPPGDLTIDGAGPPPEVLQVRYYGEAAAAEFQTRFPSALADAGLTG